MNKAIFLVFAFLFLTGCAGYYANQGTNPVNYKKGYSGLDLSIRDKIGEMYEQDISNLNIEIENKGAYDIKEGVLRLGVEKDYLEVKSTAKKDFELSGRKPESPRGEKSVFPFTIKALDLEGQSIVHDSNIYLEACYAYQTDFSKDICIDTDVYSTNENKVCEIEDISTGGGQGSPVTVRKIEPRMAYDDEEEKVRPSFNIQIENKGDGTVIGDSKVDEMCSSEGVDPDELNVVEIKAEMLHGGQLIQLDCSEREVKLRDGKGEVICTQNQGLELSAGNYLTPLHIVLEYGYMDVLSDEIRIIGRE